MSNPASIWIVEPWPKTIILSLWLKQSHLWHSDHSDSEVIPLRASQSCSRRYWMSFAVRHKSTLTLLETETWTYSADGAETSWKPTHCPLTSLTHVWQLLCFWLLVDMFQICYCASQSSILSCRAQFASKIKAIRMCDTSVHHSNDCFSCEINFYTKIPPQL